MHAPRGRGQPRVLYWFRTPPNVRVGRTALDEEAIRTLEISNPDVAFDWTRMLKERPPVVAVPTERTGRERRGGDTGPGARASRGRAAVPTPRIPPAKVVEDGGIAPLDESQDITRRPGPEPDVPAAVEGALVALPSEAAGLPPGLHVEERLGPEGFSRLRARYAELLARISACVTDPGRLEELRTEAERLNPDTWITDAEAQAGIEGFDAACDALRARLGRRRHSRRGGRRRRARAASPGVAAAGGVTQEPGTPAGETSDGASDRTKDGSDPSGQG